MYIDKITALVSLALSIFFWWNARQQASAAERTLDEIKSQIIGWQNQLNKMAIEMLSSRPEMVAMRTELAESDSNSKFTDKMATLVEELAKTGTPEHAAMVHTILDNHAKITLERHRTGIFAATGTSLNSNKS